MALSLITPEIVTLLNDWVCQAGQIALRYFNRANPILKSDTTFLTQADIEIEKFLTQRIRLAFPNHNIVGEEGINNCLASSLENIWVIDPIDGTTAFVQGLPGWGISVGLLHRGQPYFGLYYMPLLGDLSYTSAQGQVMCNELNLRGRLPTGWAPKGFLAVSASTHLEFQIYLSHMRALGSISTNLVYTARGSATAAFIPKAFLWDLVAGGAMISRVGGELRYLSGQAVDYLSLLEGQLAPEPIVAGHPNVLDELPQMIRPYPVLPQLQGAGQKQVRIT
ncbi:MAG: inositol monophosphatase [Anaerolineae bacterium]|nr:inositol monophosphatase [Anaerolineae bacterium]